MDIKFIEKKNIENISEKNRYNNYKYRKNKNPFEKTNFYFHQTYTPFL